MITMTEHNEDYRDGYAVGFQNGRYSAPYAINHGHVVPTAEQRAQCIDFKGNVAGREGWLAGWTDAIAPYLTPIVPHRWYARDGYEGCIRCGLTCEVTESRPIDDQPYPLHCGSESVCPVLGEDGRTQAHNLIGAVGGLECYYCGKHYA